MSNKVIEPMDIIYFHPDIIKKLEGNTLKTFLGLLSFLKEPRPIQFSYVCADAQLMDNISIKENIFLDSVDFSMSENKDEGFEQYLEKIGNPSLNKIIKKLPLLEKKPSEVSESERKLISIVKALLKDTKFIFLELPEKHLDPSSFELLLDALEYEAKTRNRTILISSEEEKRCITLSSKKVTFDDMKFKISPIDELSNIQEENDSVLVFKNFPNKMAS